jgi:chromate reductase
LRQILTALQVKLLSPVGNEVLVNQAMNKFEQGHLVDASTLTFLDEVLARFIQLIKE